MGGSEQRRGRERPRGRGGPEAGARTAGRAREMPQSPAALRVAAHSEGARRRDRAAKTSCSELKSPLPPSHPQSLPVPPRARLRNLAPAPTTIVPAHLTPPLWERAGRRPPQEPETRLGEGSGRELGRRWVPHHLQARGAAGKKGRRDCGRADLGWEEAGREEMRGQRRSATQEILRRETKGWSGGGEGPRRVGGRPDQNRERSGRRLRGGRREREREKGGIRAEGGWGETGKWRDWGRQKRRDGGGRQKGEGPQVSGRRV